MVYYLSAIALSVPSLAGGAIVVGFSQGFIVGSASAAVEATETVAILGIVGMLLGSLFTVVGVVIVFTCYQTGSKNVLRED